MSYNKAFLGSYIEQIDRRNDRLEYGVENVMGITNTKVLMETKARPEYADLSKFYILEPREFIYNPRTSRNGEKVGMAYNDTDHNILFTFNNIPFRIKPECRDILDSDYLYLFFLNPEFDRYARYNSWGSATELFPWEEMCRITISVPPISEQRKIVHDYQVITDRIELLRKMNENLEEQAQSVLKNYMDKYPCDFVPLSNIADIIDCLHTEKPARVDSSSYQLIQLDNIRDDGFLDLEAFKYMISEDDYTNWTRKCEIHENDCVITNVGRMGAVSQAPKGTHAAMGRNMTCIRLKKGVELQAYLITLLLSPHMKNQMQDKKDVGTIMEALNVKNIPKLLCPSFESHIMMNLENSLKPIVNNIQCRQKERQVLEKFRTVIMANLSRSRLEKGA